MVTADIIDISKDGQRYFLPKHRLPALTQPEEMSANCLVISKFYQVEDELCTTFQVNGPNGIPYSRYPDFQEWLKYVNGSRTEWSMIENNLSLIPGIKEKLEAGIRVCDVGTGAGVLPLNIAERFPRSTFWGLDISEDGIAMARKEADRLGIKNVQFVVQDASCMPSEWSDQWDLVYINDTIHDIPHACKALYEVHRTLRPGGYLLMVDEDLHTEQRDNVGNPLAPYFYTRSLFHCMPVSLAVEGGEGLGAAMGIEKAIQMVNAAGFTEVKLGPKGFVMVCTKTENIK